MQAAVIFAQDVKGIVQRQNLVLLKLQQPQGRRFHASRGCVRLLISHYRDIRINEVVHRLRLRLAHLAL